MKVEPYKIRFSITQNNNGNILHLYFDLCNTTMKDIRELKTSLYSLESSIKKGETTNSFTQRIIESTKVYSLVFSTELSTKEIKTILVDIFLNNSLCLLYMEYEIGVRFLSSALLGNFYTEESRMEEF